MYFLHLTDILNNLIQTYILGDFNINMYHNNRCIVCDDNMISSKFLSHDVKNYNQFCTISGLKQLVQSLTRSTCSTSTLIDHILIIAPSRVSQKGVINVGVSDHQLMFYTRKISRIKTGAHKYLNFRSLKNHTADYYKEVLKQVDFWNYGNFSHVNEACLIFFSKINDSYWQNHSLLKQASKSKYSEMVGC